MKPETAAFLAKAEMFLAKGAAMLIADWPDEAGRAAYLAGFHAAPALIAEIDGRTVKTHSGVRTEFARLVREEPRVDLELRRFLGRAYNLKGAADDETGPGARITDDEARQALATARRFQAAIVDLLPR